MPNATDERRIVAGVALLATLAAGLVVSIGLHDAQATMLLAPYPINGRPAVYPLINNAQYSRSCKVFRAYEDGTAFAFCEADRAAYHWEPGQKRWIPTTTTR